MRTRCFFKPTVAGLAFFFAGCGVSPILQHSNESNTNPSNTASVQKIASASLNIVWTSGPKEGGNVFVIHSERPMTLTDAWAEMPAMGHGTSPFTIHADSETQITVSDVWFNMPGTWKIYLQTQPADASTAFDVEVP